MANNGSSSLFLLGSSHHTAPLEVREKLALSADLVGHLYDRMKASLALDECLILNTCNRVEIYGVSARQDVQHSLTGYLSQHQKIQPENYNQYGFWKINKPVIQHVFEVTSGLDSQMVGETEILGQVKSSFAQADASKALGPVLNRVFQKSFQAAKWTRTNTGISRGQISIGNVASELAMRVCGELKDTSILTIGTGEVGEKTTQALVSRGAKQITFANRTFANAQKLAETYSGIAIRLEKVKEQLPNFDIIISSTASPDPLLSRQDIEPILASRPTRPLFIIDLAVPRDVEESVADVNNVYLYNMDSLGRIANENLKARLSELDYCRNMLGERSERVWNSVYRYL